MLEAYSEICLLEPLESSDSERGTQVLRKLRWSPAFLLSHAPVARGPVSRASSWLLGGGGVMRRTESGVNAVNERRRTHCVVPRAAHPRLTHDCHGGLEKESSYPFRVTPLPSKAAKPHLIGPIMTVHRWTLVGQALT
jgi:hypothetical protein